MTQRFKDKIAVVIGGNSGIGLAAAKRFAEEGAQVVLTGRNPETIKAAAAEIGPKARGVQSDTSDLKQIDSLMAMVQKEYGRIDALFANAGIGAFVPVEQVTEELWDNIFAVNLKGMFFTIQKAVPMMGKGSAIVVTSSIGHAAGMPLTSVYGASKAGVRSLARTLAGEFVQRGIRVNCISPGPVDTPIIGRTAGLSEEAIAAMKAQMIGDIPMRRMGTSEEVAAAVAFLCSDEAGFITGIDLYVDGGILSL